METKKKAGNSLPTWTKVLEHYLGTETNSSLAIYEECINKPILVLVNDFIAEKRLKGIAISFIAENGLKEQFNAYLRQNV